MRISYRLVMLKVYTEYEVTKVKVKVSHIRIAVGAVGLESHCILGSADERPSASLSFSLPYPSLIRKRYPFTIGLSERVFQSPSLELTLDSDFLHHDRAALTTRPWCLPNYCFLCPQLRRS